jgi:hypothetical protein
MKRFKNTLILRVLIALIPVAAAVAGEDSPVLKGNTATADELFAVFVAMKASTVVMQLIAQNEDPRFYSREWIEDAVRSAVRVAAQPEATGLNWVEDSLLASLSVGIAVERVYRVELIDAGTGKESLAMQVTDSCQRPSTLTITYVYENDAWRIAHVNSDSSKAGQAWFRAGLKPLKEFAHVQLRDRSRYFNESNLGKGLGLNVKDRPCGAGR